MAWIADVHPTAAEQRANRIKVAQRLSAVRTAEESVAVFRAAQADNMI
jgi:hypothetical protein